MPDPYAKYPGLNNTEKPDDLHRLLNPGDYSPRRMSPYPGINEKKINKAKKRQLRNDDVPSGPSNDYVGDLQNMLQGYNVYTPSESELKRQAQAAVDSEFAPKIRAIKEEIESAKRRAGKSKKNISKIYDALVEYYDAQEKPIKKRYAGSKADAKNRRDSLKSEIAKDYTQRLQDQVNLYKELGIQAAAPSTLSQQQSDEQSAMTQADVLGNTELGALGMEENADLSYFQEGETNAKHEGVENVAAIEDQLNEYLNRRSGDLTDLKNQQHSMYEASLSKLRENAAKSAQDAQNSLWSKMMDVAKLKLSASKTSGGSGGGEKTYDSGLYGALQYLGDERLGNYFQTALSEGSKWRNTSHAKYLFGGRTPSSPEDWAQMIQWNAARKGLSNEDQMRLWQAALVYFGRRT